MPPEHMGSGEVVSIATIAKGSKKDSEKITRAMTPEAATSIATEAFGITEHLSALLPEQNEQQTRMESELYNARATARKPITRNRGYYTEGSSEIHNFTYTAGNEVLVLDSEGEDLKVIEKTENILNEQKKDPSNTYIGDAFSIDNTETLRREWLAYLIDRSLGLGTVPTTVLRGTAEGLASWQEWKTNTHSAQKMGIVWDEISPTNEAFQRLALTQIAVFNADAHNSNVLVQAVDKKGLPTKLWQIDNGFSNALRADNARDGAWTAIAGAPIEQKLIDRMQWFLDTNEAQATLRDAFDITFGKEYAQDYWQAFMDRIQGLCAKKVFPKKAMVQKTQHDVLQFAETYAVIPNKKAA